MATRPILQIAALAATVVMGALVATVAVNQGRFGVGSRSTDPTASPSGTQMTDPEDLEYSCLGREHTFRPDIFDEQETDLTSLPAGIALAQFIQRGSQGFDLPPDGWHLAGIDDSSAAFVVEIPRSPWFNDVFLNLHEGRWQVDGYGGGCRPEVVFPDLNSATWWLVPDQDLSGATTTFEAWVSENACASGEPADDRIRAPLIFSEPERVVVVFTVEQQTGGQYCPSHPPTRVRVDLSEPVGDRQLLDGGTLPWRDVRDD